MINLVVLFDQGAPSGGGDVVDFAHHTSQGLPRLCYGRHCLQVVRTPNETLRGWDRSWEILIPIPGGLRGVEYELFAVDRAGGHHLILAPVVTHGLALPIFHDRRIAAGIRP